MASPAHAVDDVNLVYETDSWRAAPCNSARIGSSPTPLLVVLLVGLNYVPVVVFSLSMGVDAGKVVFVVLFHISLVLMFASWLYTCCTDPGTPPESWQRQMAAAVARGETVAVCRRSGLYSARPPASACAARAHAPRRLRATLVGRAHRAAALAL